MIFETCMATRIRSENVAGKGRCLAKAGKETKAKALSGTQKVRIVRRGWSGLEQHNVIPLFASFARHHSFLLLVWHFRVVLPQQVFAEVVVEIAPDGVDVVGVVLRVVVLDEKSWSLHAIVMRVAFFDAAGPRKINFVPPGLVDPCEI